MTRNSENRKLLTTGDFFKHYNAELNEFVNPTQKPKTQEEVDKEPVSNKEYWDAFYRELSTTPRFEEWNELFNPDVHVKPEVINITDCYNACGSFDFTALTQDRLVKPSKMMMLNAKTQTHLAKFPAPQNRKYLHHF